MNTKRGQPTAERQRQIDERQRQIDERREHVVALYASGMSVAAVAERIGCHPQTARADLREAGVEVRGTNAPQTEPRICAREGCVNVFRPSPRQLRNGDGRFCSRKCGREAHRIHPQPDERVCARHGCENRFTPGAWNAAHGWGSYCSKRCSALSTGAHRRKQGRLVPCRNCGAERWRYDSTVGAGFCSLKCATTYRWKHGIGISPNVWSLATGRARQKHLGRWGGSKGGAAGIEGGREGGRPPTATREQSEEIWRLRDEGHSVREIATAVFGDGRFKDRVARILRGPS